MTDQVNWLQQLEQRRLRAGEPDEATLARHLERWRHALEDEQSLPDEELDDQMVKLLELIHHSR